MSVTGGWKIHRPRAASRSSTSRPATSVRSPSLPASGVPRRDGVGGDADLALRNRTQPVDVHGDWSASQRWEARRMPSSAHRTLVPFQAFEAADGWLVVACPKETLWRGLPCPALGPLPTTSGSPTSAPATVTAASSSRSCRLHSTADRFRWVDLMSAHKVPCAPVNDILELSPTPRPLPAAPWPVRNRPSGWFAPSDTALRLDLGLASHLRGALPRRALGASPRRCVRLLGGAHQRALAALGVLGQLEPTAAEP